ncbi:Cytochrome oxidase biogenesis protein Sco1/SenC/PrrC, putative copper metallochaperone [Planococcus halocryophilus Or1]|uniref:Cytochrome c oxidase assembly protein n=1 Tax=Planococcus halocryophilus TaxID=1215089 RepID=A0A1C7DUN8_9BACL|nr:SCO family protein [Planococcus halocryophilus]ANU14933.1 cytochrome c oxidase assembly protein [Planococcus halocryophilus]EMF45604.1 Cytochrome oxidase biogenesis protein Sco1/SenC/PrrC, putative copper metallochaperone [Planococcus halocryophilus Or1]
MQKYKNLLLAVLFSIFLGACSPSIEDPLEWKIDDFTFTNQNNKEFGLADLEGKVWLADFVFTNCTTVCLPMMSNMTGLQEQLKEQGLDVQIVSFSVDPLFDKPEVLKSYAENYGADLSTWNMLTGYTPQEIDDFAMHNFQTLARKPENDDQVIHGTYFYLVNQEGVIMKSYEGLNPPVEEILADVEILLTED